MQMSRWIRDELPFSVVAALVLCGVAALALWPDHWRPDVAVMALALFVAAIERAVLPTPRVGVLATRTRGFDVVTYAALGGVILALAIRLH
jgi:hypothetical protein